MSPSRQSGSGALAVGVDLVQIRRIVVLAEKYGERFTGRVFTPAELAECNDRAESLAARWAAKEAVVKALGTGFGPVSFHEIELIRACAGQPELRLGGKARDLAQARGLESWSVSVAHDGGYAIAFVIAA